MVGLNWERVVTRKAYYENTERNVLVAVGKEVALAQGEAPEMVYTIHTVILPD